MYRREENMASLLKYFTVLGVFIACLGLFGLTAFLAEQRTKEIGIRKTLGASLSDIIGLLSKESVVLITAANIIAWPLAYYFLSKWFQNFVYHVQINIVIFAVSSIAALLLALLTVGFTARKAACADPVKSLRYQ